MMDLPPAETGLLLIDVQERFLSAIPSIAPDQGVGRRCGILLAAAAEVGVATVVTEQYPKGLGRTLPYLAAAAGGAPRLEKTHFSCCDDGGIERTLDGLHRSWWVLCGIEAHVCVLATAADLRARGRHVVIAADAVDSRDPAARDVALAAARDLGCLVLPTETIVFRWLRRAQGEAFKRIAALVR